MLLKSTSATVAPRFRSASLSSRVAASRRTIALVGPPRPRIALVTAAALGWLCYKRAMIALPIVKLPFGGEWNGGNGDEGSLNLYP